MIKVVIYVLHLAFLICGDYVVIGDTPSSHLRATKAQKFKVDEIQSNRIVQARLMQNEEDQYMHHTRAFPNDDDFHYYGNQDENTPPHLDQGQLIDLNDVETSHPTRYPSHRPSPQPPTTTPTLKASGTKIDLDQYSGSSSQPSVEVYVSNLPTPLSSNSPTSEPSSTPSTIPTSTPSTTPSTSPSATPSTTPSTSPSATPSVTPSAVPSAEPSSTKSSDLMINTSVSTVIRFDGVTVPLDDTGILKFEVLTKEFLIAFMESTEGHSALDRSRDDLLFVNTVTVSAMLVGDNYIDILISIFGNTAAENEDNFGDRVLATFGTYFDDYIKVISDAHVFTNDAYETESVALANKESESNEEESKQKTFELSFWDLAILLGICVLLVVIAIVLYKNQTSD